MAGPAVVRDFDLTVTRHGDGLVVRVLDSPAGETRAVRTTWSAHPVPGSTEWSVRNAAHTAGTRDVGIAAAPLPATATELAAAGQRDLGQALFDAVFTGDVLARYRESRRQVSELGSVLRLMLRFDGGADVLPWELLWDPESRRYLALDPTTAIVRCTEMPARDAGPERAGPLRVLVAVSTPAGTAPLDAAGELRRLTDALEPLRGGGALAVDVLEDASLDAIRRRLAEDPVHVFHYVGHGSLEPDGRSTLELTAPDGSRSARPADDVATVLASSTTLRLAVLNACHGSPGHADDPFAGAATTLVKAGVPAVVAMRRAISDTAAVTFAGELYRGLAAGERIEAAVTAGRAALFAADGPAAREWSTIALHLGSSLGTMWTASPLPRVDDDVEFTVSRPRQLRAARWEAMLVFAHHGERFRADDGRTIDQRADVHARIAGFYGAELAGVHTSVEEASGSVPRGAGLVVEPELPGLTCDPPRAELTWTGEIAEARFLVRAPSGLAGATLRGWLRVFMGPLVLGETEISFDVVAETVRQPVPLGEEPLRRYRRIFPCFAAEDAELVESVVAVAEALGDRYTMDAIDAQRSGAPVEFALPQITDADVFQLFWSSHSMRSPACQRQWEQALAIGRDGFVRPLYWEEPFPRADGLPPAALAALRFVRLPHQAPRHHPVGEAPAGQVHAPPVRPPAAERPAAASASRPGAAAPPRRPPSAVTDVSAPSGKPPPAPSRRRPRSGIGAGISVGVALLIVSIVTGTTSPSGATLDPGAGDDRGSVLAVVSLVAGLVLIGGSLARWWLRRRR